MENNLRARLLRIFSDPSGAVVPKNAWWRVLLIVCLAVAFSLVSSGVWAATEHLVTGTDLNAFITGAIPPVAPGDTLILSGTVSVTGTIDLSLLSDLRIVGFNGVNRTIEVSAAGQFTAGAGDTTLTLENVTITSAKTSGHVFSSTGNLQIDVVGNVIFDGTNVSNTTNTGSLINAIPTVTPTNPYGNINLGTDGGGSVTVQNFHTGPALAGGVGNVSHGGAIHSRYGAIAIGNASGTVTLRNNYTTGVGAAVFIVDLAGPDGRHITVDGTQIRMYNNEAEMHSGVMFTGDGNITIGNPNTQIVFVDNNTAGGSGGAIQASGGTVTIRGQNIELTGNTVTNSGGDRGSGGGGAILGSYGVYIGNAGSIVRIEDNHAVGRGGAIYTSTLQPAQPGSVEIQGSKISLIDNSAGVIAFVGNESTGGGAIFANKDISLNAGEIIISGNTARTHGGALEATGNVTITGSVTATGNETEFALAPLAAIRHQGGGVIWAGSDVTLNATGDSAFIGNTAGGTSYGGAIRAGGTVTLNAIGGDITFQGNVSHFDPAAGHQRGQAIWFDNVSGDGAVFHAESGQNIIFDGNSIDNDEAQGLLTVRTTGSGAVIFDGATSGIYGDTTVEAGTFVVRNDAVYGLLQADAQNLAGGAGATELSSFTVSAGSTLAGGALEGGVRAGTVAADNIRISGTLDIAGTGIPALGHTVGNAEGGYSEFTLRGANQIFDADSQILFNTHLNDASTQLTDLLILELEGGQTSSDEAMIFVRNTGGGGAVCTGDGIMLVQTNNGISEGAFRLGNRVAAGAYQYMLFQGGIDGDPTNAQNWYLRSRIVDGGGGNGGGPPPTVPIYRPEVPVGIVVPALASRLGLSTLGTWHERRDGEFATNYTMPDGYERAGWARIFGNVGRYGRGYSGSLTSRVNSFYKHGPSYDFSITGIQAGVDLRRRENDEEDNRWRDMFGLYFAAGWARADVHAIKDFGFGLEAGRTKMTGYSIGAYYTYIDQGGWYVDAVLQATRYSNISTTSRIDEPQYLSTRGWGWLASLESGYPIELNEYWIIEPQAQLIYEHLSIRDGSDAFGRISFSNSGTLYGRLGARLNRDWTRDDGRRMNAWGRVSLWSDFGSQARTTFSSLEGLNPRTFGVDLGGTWAQFDLGITGQLSETTSIFAVGNYNVSVRSIRGYSWGGRIGLRVHW